MTEEHERALTIGATLMSLEDVEAAAREIRRQQAKKVRDPIAAALSMRKEQALVSAVTNLARLLRIHLDERESKAQAAREIDA